MLTKSVLAGFIVIAALTAGQSAALASANCAAHPKAEWLSEAQMKAKVEGQGYKIKVFKVSGDCYEIYGWTKDGKKAEIYFDTKTGDPVKTNID
jgi:hypothetical protein